LILFTLWLAEPSLKRDFYIVLLLPIFFVVALLPIGNDLLLLHVLTDQFFHVVIFLQILLIEIHPPIDFIEVSLGHLIPILLLQRCHKGKFRVLPTQTALTVAHSTVNEVLYLPSHRQLPAFILQIHRVKGYIIGDKS
jgi:hypothetical protein